MREGSSSRIIPLERPTPHLPTTIATPSSRTRFKPPRLHADYVENPGITARFADNGRTAGTILLLTGPPGCGKTAILAHHFALSHQAGRSPLWLTITRDDNDPAILARSLNGLLEQDGSFGWPFTSHDPAASAPSLPDGIDLFVDGLEYVRNDDARALVEAFMADVPPDSRIYASAHAIRVGPFHDGRLRGMVRQIPCQDFRLDDAQARQILGDSWSVSEIQRLNLIVDGWAAGLRFLSLDPDAARRMISDARIGSAIPIEMAHYFDDVVCADMDAATLAGLMDVSVLDRFTAHTLADMPGQRCTWQLIDDHVRSGLFLRHVDDARLWVAFHPAFGRHLRHRLRNADPARFEELQRFSAAWFQDHGFSMEAMRHASHLSDTALAMRVMENAGGLLVELGNGPFMEDERAITLDQLHDLPMVFLSQIYLKIRTAHLVEARNAFELMRGHSQNFTCYEGRSDGLAIVGFARVMEILLDLMEDRAISDADLATFERSFTEYQASEPVIAASIASLLAMAYNGLSRHADAATVCDIGLHAVRDFGATKVAIFLRVQQAVAALARDTVSKSVLYIEDGARLAQAEGDFGNYEMLITRILRAELHYEANELDAAQALIEPALAQIQQITGWVHLFATGFTVAAAIAGIGSGLEAANLRLVAGESLARQKGLPRLELLLSITRLRELTRAREWRQANELIGQAELADVLSMESVAITSIQIQVPALLEAARLMIEMGRLKEGAAYLERVNKTYLDQADNRQIFLFRLLAMRTAFGLRRYNAAVDHMQTTLGVAMRAGLMRRAISNRLPLIEVFDWSVRNGQRPPAALTEFVNDVLRGASERDDGATILRRRARSGSSGISPNFSLSPRETEIIALVAEGYLTKEVAVRLNISEGTVKSHRKKIHEKLGVASRSQAIARARELLII